MKGRPSGEMRHIGNILESFSKRFTPPQSIVEQECISVIYELMNVTLKKTQIEYIVATKTIYLKVPSILKTELLTRQDEILSKLQSRLPQKNTPTNLL